MPVILVALLCVGCPDEPSPTDTSLQQDAFRADVDPPVTPCGDLFEDPETGDCVPCVEDAHCKDGLVCHPTARECVGCFDDNDCRHGVCVPGKSYCAQCFADDHCSSGHCDGERQVCVGCGRDADCDDGDPCTAGFCTDVRECRYERLAECDATPCVNNEMCEPGVQWCAKAPGDCDGQGHCVERPHECPNAIDWVCGANEVSYRNECHAAAAGICVVDAGMCPCQTDEGCPDRHICQLGDSGVCPTTDGAAPEPGLLGTCVPEATGCDETSPPVCICGGTLVVQHKCAAWNEGLTEWGDCPDPGTCHVNADCPDDSYCQHEGCPEDTDVGHCAPLPEPTDVPVCGCDGTTYSSALAAAKSGVSIEAEGPCECAAPCECPELICPNDTLPIDTTGDLCPDACQCGEVDADGVSVIKYQCSDGELCAEKSAPNCNNTVKICVPAIAETGPMCGCDGKEYPNAKAVHAANMAIKYAGPCL